MSKSTFSWVFFVHRDIFMKVFKALYKEALTPDLGSSCVCSEPVNPSPSAATPVWSTPVAFSPPSPALSPRSVPLLPKTNRVSCRERRSDCYPLVWSQNDSSLFVWKSGGAAVLWGTKATSGPGGGGETHWTSGDDTAGLRVGLKKTINTTTWSLHLKMFVDERGFECIVHFKDLTHST